jgi:signal transduction histidine kinase
VLSRSARSRDIDLSSETVSGELPIKCDRVLLQEVIINLVVNSIDALTVMPRAKRKVTLTTTRVKSFAEVAVADTGPGIPINKADVVFEPNFTTKPHGMGMGLFIARTIIEAHGGRIWTDNRIGGGAVFHVRLPLSKSVI